MVGAGVGNRVAGRGMVRGREAWHCVMCILCTLGDCTVGYMYRIYKTMCRIIIVL